MEYTYCFSWNQLYFIIGGILGFINFILTFITLWSRDNYDNDTAYVSSVLSSLVMFVSWPLVAPVLLAILIGKAITGMRK